ncbi:DUF6171 family protein [Alkalicoccobacillus porphyridii]|uniref:Uncharacterized protein n=1 Tax=Alkalicoccobacillus porphyridii TaxID=2597270 RepID=A0A553ZUX2_9BACI|nr:DUF6171 family protein [Alkalicoccobacillus porphyridii]TSB45257.1 hypothetical protein FN960_17485 [Alkalicoccobacillus porphyridii]
MACKGCLLKEELQNTTVQQLVEEQLKFETDLTNDDVYQQRLRECEQCPSLSHETTCQHCGCFVQFRARLAYKSCPFPGQNKWKAFINSN